jgi:cbb3-type cytochrome c oxidase subunit III
MENWMAEHFRAPASVVAGSQMPALNIAESEIDLLTLYTLSLRRREMRDVYLPRDRVRAVKLGEREFATDGATLFGAFCAGCHGADGMGKRVAGVVSFPSIANPDFLAVASDAFLTATVKSGRPGRRMAGWLKDGGLRPAELETVVRYVRTLGGTAVETDARPARWVSAPAERGRVVFEASCSGCHGVRGKGGEGPALNNKVLLAAATDTYLVETIRRGRRGTAMAGFATASPVRPALDAPDIEAVVSYLRGLEGGK